jgi:multiple sugar transport system substrate-binding protein
VLKYLNSPTAQKRFALATGQPPAHKELYQDKELLAKYPHFATIATALNSARLRPATIAYPQISAEVLQVQLIRALQQRDAVKNILQIITDRSQPLVR